MTRRPTLTGRGIRRVCEPDATGAIRLDPAFPAMAWAAMIGRDQPAGTTYVRDEWGVSAADDERETPDGRP
ncbi:hypothetical protein Uis1B_2184 [Bifidobacterium margollesii]|uniref:Uncharacterized protein n=1 Tax=Bifidobacterium margollesii TaxID=2020964 RepID=A0A2N5J6Z6_9BIFI|nr:hypothetical protein [Bifidobacterium margollesii]PLS29978.1 hypothetical protein Uis1B_2184 [Bifidobacterium margollesii]